MNTLLKMGQKLVDALERMRRGLAPLTDRLLDRLGGARVTPEAASQAGMHGFELEADAVMSRCTSVAPAGSESAWAVEQSCSTTTSWAWASSILLSRSCATFRSCGWMSTRVRQFTPQKAVF